VRHSCVTLTTNTSNPQIEPNVTTGSARAVCTWPLDDPLHNFGTMYNLRSENPAWFSTMMHVLYYDACQLDKITSPFLLILSPRTVRVDASSQTLQPLACVRLRQHKDMPLHNDMAKSRSQYDFHCTVYQYFDYVCPQPNATFKPARGHQHHHKLLVTHVQPTPAAHLDCMSEPELPKRGFAKRHARTLRRPTSPSKHRCKGGDICVSGITRYCTIFLLLFSPLSLRGTPSTHLSLCRSTNPPRDSLRHPEQPDNPWTRSVL
jgi:hypothetical protein